MVTSLLQWQVYLTTTLYSCGLVFAWYSGRKLFFSGQAKGVCGTHVSLFAPKFCHASVREDAFPDSLYQHSSFQQCLVVVLWPYTGGL